MGGWSGGRACTETTVANAIRSGLRFGVKGKEPDFELKTCGVLQIIAASEIKHSSC